MNVCETHEDYLSQEEDEEEEEEEPQKCIAQLQRRLDTIVFTS